MQKYLKYSCVIGLICCMGCTTKQSTTAVDEEYETYYNCVLENPVYDQESTYFHTSLEMTSLDDGTYRYYIVIDDAQVAMYDVIAMVVENDIPYEDAEKMMPSIGIFDEPKSMIPGQVNTKNGFVKGIALGGECDSPSIDLKILVQWKDQVNSKNTKEFLAYTLSVDQPIGNQE